MDHWTRQTMTQNQRIKDIFTEIKTRAKKYTSDPHMQDVMVYIQVCALEDGTKLTRDIYDGRLE